MFICLDCGRLFEEAVAYTETHGFTDGLYETWNGCPRCGGAFVETRCCDNCGEYIVNQYIKTTSGELICDNCYVEKDISEGVQ